MVGTTLEHLESAMVNSIPSLGGNVLAENSVKYAMVALASYDSTSSWSVALPISSAGDFYCELATPEMGPPRTVQLSVQVVQEHIYIVLSDASAHPPYRIENASSFAIRYIRCPEKKVQTLAPTKWAAFVWPDPMQRDRKIEVRVDDKNHVDGCISAFIDIEHVGYAAPLKLANGWEISVVVTPVHNTRVLRFMDTKVESLSTHTQRQTANELKQYYASTLNVRLAGIGCSLFNMSPHEVLFVSIDYISFSKLPGGLEWEFKVFHAQIDNMLKKQHFPVLLEPIGSGYSSVSKDKSSPMIHLKIDSTVSETVLAYELFELRIAPLAFKLDIDYLVMVISMFHGIVSSNDSSPLSHQNNMLLKHLTCSLPLPTRLNSGSLLYIETFRIHATTLELEWLLRRGTMQTTGSHYAIELIMSLLSILGSNLSGSPSLRFNEIVIHQCFTSSTSLFSQLEQSYTRQAVMQAYRVLGSTDLLGDPIGIVENLGSGVAQFFRITKGEVMGDTATRGEGFMVLGKTLMHTGASSAAKITGSLDRLVGGFVCADTRNTSSATPPKSSFAQMFGRELTGIVRKPFQGAQKAGIPGLLKGAVLGIVGPGVAVLKAVTFVSHKVCSGVEAQMIDRAPFKGRRRNPKKFIDGALVTHSSGSTADAPSLMKLYIIGARGLYAGNSCDATCYVYIDEKKVFRTKTFHNTVNPNWNENKAIALNGRESVITFAVKDVFATSAMETTIGSITLPLSAFIQALRPVMGLSHLAQWAQTGVQPDFEATQPKSISHQCVEKEFSLTCRKAPMDMDKKKLDRVTIHILEAIGLGKKGSSDTYVSVSFGGRQQKTSVTSSSHNPEWKDGFTFPYYHGNEEGDQSFSFKVYSKGLLNDSILARATFKLDNATTSETIERSIPLTLTGSSRALMEAKLRIRIELTIVSGVDNVIPRSIPQSKVGSLLIAADFS